MDNANATPIDDIVDALKQKHKHVVEATVEGRTFVFRRPSMAEYSRFVEKVSDARVPSFRQLCMDCCVHPLTADGKPDVFSLNAIFSEYPALCSKWAGQIQDIGGGGSEFDATKR